MPARHFAFNNTGSSGKLSFVRVDLNRIAEEIRRDEGNARIEIVEEDAIEAEIRLREHLISATSRATSPSDGFWLHIVVRKITRT